MSYLKIEVDGAIKEDLTPREVDILQATILNLAAMMNALLTGERVMLNPADEGKLGVTFAYSNKLSVEKEQEISETFLNKLNTFFQMSKLDLTAYIKGTNAAN